MIDSYRFGEIVLDGQGFTADLIIASDGTVHANWWRKEGHALHAEDLGAVLADRPEVLVVGTGSSGMMRVAPDAAAALEQGGIELVGERTGRAVQAYNDLLGRRRVAGAFHLTC